MWENFPKEIQWYKKGLLVLYALVIQNQWMETWWQDDIGLGEILYERKSSPW